MGRGNDMLLKKGDVSYNVSDPVQIDAFLGAGWTPEAPKGAPAKKEAAGAKAKGKPGGQAKGKAENGKAGAVDGNKNKG
jgi:hypothetical protein